MRWNSIALLGGSDFSSSGFARRFAGSRGRPFELSPETIDCLSRHPFPGNVRELLHLVERLAVVCPEGVVEPDHLPDEYRCAAQSRVEISFSSFNGTLSEMAQAFEKRVLQQALARVDGHRAQAAEALGISRKNLWEKLKLHGLDS